jgi:hypothetical protein
VTSVVRTSYQRRCDECRSFYEHVKGAPTGWCPACAEAMLVAVPEPPPYMRSFKRRWYHLPYMRSFRKPGGDE